MNKFVESAQNLPVFSQDPLKMKWGMHTQHQPSTQNLHQTIRSFFMHNVYYLARWLKSYHMRTLSYKVRGNNHWKLLNIQGKLWGSPATWHSNKLPSEQYTQTWNILPTICRVHTHTPSSWLLQVLPGFFKSHFRTLKLLSPLTIWASRSRNAPPAVRCPSQSMAIFGNGMMSLPSML